LNRRGTAFRSDFTDTVDKLLEADAAVRVENPGELLAVLASWLDDPAAAKAVGDRARRFIAAQRGAVPAAVRALVGLLEGQDKKEKLLVA
jgi:3-deoxy-D-manno-octulosonic-acid transferase